VQVKHQLDLKTAAASGDAISCAVMGFADAAADSALLVDCAAVVAVATGVAVAVAVFAAADAVGSCLF
jgi:hypothetical protein